MPGAPYTNYLALLFFAVVVGSNVTSESGRWTLALFAVVVSSWSLAGTTCVVASAT